ncbi:XrtA system polysaccharide chain length determinant [Saccharospirillum salsuginis]|uniref:Polysaccharide chain length determinant N-terminal domain-containing protein n=1 Tax=Saccharospirillum salsuginis TaxID=418750 RepID=A0A918K4H8_9GAMM|nr:XrtA system polysaccharide chain length determinant [Saccharospirillum salsuginis]GGX49516.1 hypothetical protein GCM10007392_16050 [Saccharospirillum salsuginis]
MDLRFIIDTLNAVKRELVRMRWVAVLVFILATSGVLVMGYTSPKSYTSSALLYADNSNILQPLLRDRAEVTAIDRLNEAREMLQSRTLLEQVAMDASLITADQSDRQRNGTVSQLRNAINLRVTGGSFIQLSYSSGDPDQSFQVMSAVLNRFIEKTVSDKRSESREAFEFIDSQVQSYKRQLEVAENKLKEFKSNNLDGTEAAVQGRIERLRSDIQELTLQIEETESQVRLTREQLGKESPYREVMIDRGQTSLDMRLENLRQQLDTLRLSYLDSHPDIVNVKDQIAELEQQRKNDTSDGRQGAVTEVIENPIYENLSIKLANNETQLEVQRKRLDSLKTLLQEAYERAERVANNETVLQELTRDYDVTRDVYEDMLQTREKARLSMTLDVEGQGVSYRIQEPASYPARWDGLQLYEIGAAGPVLGGGLVLGLLTALVLFDNRIRSGRNLMMQMPEDIPILATIPHYKSSFVSRLLRWDVITIALLISLFMVGYLGVLAFSVMGIQPDTLVEWISSRLEG